jgi:hypothetical protein
VISSGDMIDVTLDVNAFFMTKHSMKLKKNDKQDIASGSKQIPVKVKKTVEKPVEKSEKQSSAEPEKKKSERKRVLEIDDPEGFTRKQNMFDLDMDQKELSIQKMKEEIELKKIQKQKALGQVVPTDMVKIVFTQHNKSIVSAFQNAADNLISTISKKKELTREDSVQIRGEIIEIINEAVKESTANSIAHLKNIVKEYSEKKGVGEHG